MQQGHPKGVVNTNELLQEDRAGRPFLGVGSEILDIYAFRKSDLTCVGVLRMNGGQTIDKWRKKSFLSYLKASLVFQRLYSRV